MNCIVNVSENWGIGKDGQLLFSISADLKRFRQLTLGKTVILGRKTLATFPGEKPLPGRTNLVLSRQPNFQADNAVIFHSFPELALFLHAYPTEELWVIGGASVYERMLPYCSHAFITKTFCEVDADSFFPNLDALPQWHFVSESPKMEEGNLVFRYLEYHNDSPCTF